MANRMLPTELLGLIKAAQRQSLNRPWRLASSYLRSNAPMSRPFSTTLHHQQASETPFSSSVSTNEVSHFSKLAASWWDPHGPSRLLHLMNPLRHDFIQTCLHSDPSSPQKDLNYLDIGCGGGIFATSAARLPSTTTVTAIDPTPEVIAVAKTKQRTDPVLLPPKLSYLQCSVEELASTNFQPVDILTVFEVLEHVSSPSHFLSMCIPLVKPGGWIIGSTIARSPLSFITTKLIAEAPIIGVVPRGTHDWNKYINPEELREWCAGQPSLGQVLTKGVIYLPALGWKFVNGSENYGNYFVGVQKLDE
jgi:polyprenyldihydroxybenzoate methyltransferase/3-demethylubiquinol 3-O-methyltransferase